MQRTTIYSSLLLPWTPPTHHPSIQETSYRAAGLLRTKGTIFLLPPPLPVLKSTYNAPPRPKTRMSSGAVALCKHFERGGASSEHGRAHPYWTLPRGSNERKSEIAGEVLERMLGEVVWRNVMLLHPGVAVYEVRNSEGWGMRWTLGVEEVEEDSGKTWRILDTTFRGFVEPIEGMDHELDRVESDSSTVL